MRACADMPLFMLVLLLSVRPILALQSHVGSVEVDSDLERHLQPR